MFFCFKQKTAYEMRISDWSSDVCSSDLVGALHDQVAADARRLGQEGGAPLACRLDVAGLAGDAVQPQIAHQMLAARLRHLGARHGDDGDMERAPQQRLRSEARRVWKECVSTCRFRWAQYT